MNSAIKEIIEIKRQNDPNDPDFYTEEWVIKHCQQFNQTPQEFLDEMKADFAAAELLDYDSLQRESDKKRKENPEFYEYMTGPIDAHSYELMLKSGEIKDVDNSKQ